MLVVRVDQPNGSARSITPAHAPPEGGKAPLMWVGGVAPPAGWAKDLGRQGGVVFARLPHSHFKKTLQAAFETTGRPAARACVR